MANENIDDLEQRIAALDPSDPEALKELERSIMLGDSSDDKAEEEELEDPGEEVTPESTVAAKPDEKVEEPKGETSTTPEPVVLTRDGKHTIPYTELENARDRAARAEATVQALNEQLKSIKKGGEPGDEGKQGEVSITDDELGELDEISPEIAKVIRAQMSKIEQLSGVVVELNRDREVTKTTRAQEVQDTVRAAIESTPDLVAWREEATREDNPDPKRWERAQAFDDMLQQDPEWQDKSFEERFAKAAQMTRAFYGDEAATSKPVTPAPTIPAKKESVSENSIPMSLSDIPGSTPAGHSMRETLENASAVSLGNRFLNMTPEQIESELARLG